MESSYQNLLQEIGPILQENDEEKENGDRQQWSGFTFERGVSYRVGEAVFLTPKQVYILCIYYYIRCGQGTRDLCLKGFRQKMKKKGS
jgi:hypothetical protein